MTTFAVTDPNHTLAAINYVLQNLGSTSGGNGNVTIPANVVTANSDTGIISTYGNTGGTPYWFQYQFINLRYANNAAGTSGFSTVPTNANYFGIYNSVTATPSTNPAAYNWNQVAGGFGTTKNIYYSAIGGRQVQWAAANSAPSADFVASVPNVAINIDIVTTAAGTPGERGPLAMGYVVTPSDPTVASSSTLTGWFQAPRGNTVAPIGTGLAPPVTGDTASFIYISGNTQPSAVYTFNGSTWANVVAQVIPGNTIVANTITGTTIAANTITGNNIVLNTITSNRIAANTITANNIAVGANITGSQIAANTITANNLAAGTIVVANSIQSNNATFGSNSSAGFWLDASTGNVRFGGNTSVGNNLAVGNNATIGGNLTVSGLIVNGGLANSTVSTTTILPGNVSTSVNGSTGLLTLTSNAIANTKYYQSGATITTTVPNESVLVFMTMGLRGTISGSNVTVNGQMNGTLQRYNTSTGGPGSTLSTATQFFIGLTNGGQVLMPAQNFPAVVDVIATPGTYAYAWGASLSYSYIFGSPTAKLELYPTSSANTVFLNNMSVVGLKR